MRNEETTEAGPWADLEERTTEELQAERDRLQAEADDIAHQLDMAVARKHETGEWADPGWFARARRALRGKRREADRIGRYLAHQRRAEGRRSTASHFVDVARERLPEETFKALLMVAVNRAKRGE